MKYRIWVERALFLTFLLSFICSFQNLESEISSHEALTKVVVNTGYKLIREGHFASHEITECLKKLEDSVENLKDEAKQRRRRLMQSYETHQFLAEVRKIHEVIRYPTLMNAWEYWDWSNIKPESKTIIVIFPHCQTGEKWEPCLHLAQWKNYHRTIWIKFSLSIFQNGNCSTALQGCI